VGSGARWLVGAFVVVAAAVPLGACALLVGDPDGHKLFTESTDGESPDSTSASSGKDAADEAASTDGGAMDAQHPDAADAGGVSDADAGTMPDGEAGPGIFCGSRSCDVHTQVCCMTNPLDPVDGSACVAPGQCVGPGVAFYCSKTEDCINQGHPSSWFCCSNVQPETYADVAELYVYGSHCAPSCGGYSWIYLCDQNDPASLATCASVEAGAPSTCQLINYNPANYYGCQN
jgi:hypothetical protein